MQSMNFSQFFTTLGFTTKESSIFLALYKLWTVPASTVAKHTRLERTWVYKSLRDMTKKGLVNHTKKKGVSHFWVSSPQTLRTYLHQQQAQLEQLDESFPEIE